MCNDRSAEECKANMASHPGYPLKYLATDCELENKDKFTSDLLKRDPANETVLWPEGKIPLKDNDRPIKFLEDELWQRNVLVTDINEPFFVFHKAAGEGPRPVVVVLPGGGYTFLGVNKEGSEIADWLNSLGISAAVLYYRAPGQRDAALCDTQRAIGILRRDAAKYGIDPGKVGVIGFSAGANLTARISTNWRKRFYEPIDDADDFPCRPDFQLPIYLWDVTNKDTKRPDEPYALRPEYSVDADTPPAFLSQTMDDFCNIETTFTFERALRNVGVKTEVHAFECGGHGYGLRRRGFPCDVWSDLAATWLKRILG